jgi:peptidoglycan/LPS O-acetylase OafA/YrhL
MEPPRYLYIDSLRGWAILLVILTHAALGQAAIDGLVGVNVGPGLMLPSALATFCGAAVFGVPLFFVATALSQYFSWRTREITDAASLRDYFIRRFFRIAPLFYAAIAFYLWLFGWGPRAFAPTGIGLSDVLVTAIFMHGWKWNAINSVVPGAWSLGATAMFYVGLPVLIAIMRSRWLFAITTLSAVGLSQALELYVQARNAVHGPLGWFGFPAEAVVFLFGLWAARWIWARKELRPPLPTPFGRALSVALFLALIVALPFIHIPVKLIAYRMQFAGLAALLCAALHFYPVPVLVGRPIAAIGRRSYSMFVLHFALLSPVFRVASKIAGPLFGMHGAVGLLVVYFSLLLVASALVGAITYALIERPFIGAGQRLIDRLNARPSGEAMISA